MRQAVAYLQQHGFGPIELSGYSFGTWVNAQCAVGNLSEINMTMVSPPTAFMDFRMIQHLPGLTLAITGSRDDIAPPDMLPGRGSPEGSGPPPQSSDKRIAVIDTAGQAPDHTRTGAGLRPGKR